MSPRLTLEDEEGGLPWWASGWNSELTLQGCQFDPVLGAKIPHEAKNENKVVKKKKKTDEEEDVCIGTHPYVFRIKDSQT